MPSPRLAVLPVLALTTAVCAQSGTTNVPSTFERPNASATRCASTLDAQLDELSNLRATALRARDFDRVQEIDALTVELLSRWEASVVDGVGAPITETAQRAHASAPAPSTLPSTEPNTLVRRPAPTSPYAPSGDASFVAFSCEGEDGMPFNARRTFIPIDFKARFGDATFVLVTDDSLVVRRVPTATRPAPGIMLEPAAAEAPNGPSAVVPQHSGRRVLKGNPRPAPGTELGLGASASGTTDDMHDRIEAIRRALAVHGG